MTKAIEAAARGLAAAQGDDLDSLAEWHAANVYDEAKAAITAYLAAMKAEGFVMVRVERVSGGDIADWRANLSPELHETGDCVLAWVNEGDLTTAEINAMIAAATPQDDGGE